MLGKHKLIQIQENFKNNLMIVRSSVDKINKQNSRRPIVYEGVRKD